MARAATLVPPVVLIAAACGSSSSGSSGLSSSCNDAYDCAADQTCWTQDGHTYACQPAGSLPAGSSCNPDTPALSCGPHTACLGINNVGTCTYWCNADGSCPGEMENDSGIAASPACTAVTTTEGATVRFCVM